MKNKRLKSKILDRAQKSERFLTCPKCSSKKIKIIEYIGAKCIVCNNCDYDESSVYDVYPEEKKSQKEKARYSPYKTGGPRRTK